MRYTSSLTRTDGVLVVGTVVVAFVTGVLLAPATDLEALHLIDVSTNVVIFAAVLLMLVPLVRASQHWGGQIGRNLQLIALGLLVFVVTIVPHIEWHVRGAPSPIGPPMFGLSAAWWAGFFHVLTIVSWIVIIYGFYRFWRLARPRNVSDQ